uniref:Uncharacterized protein n=1 Tax=Manihot esculenta TaxID=3983 RepID=A0A2C9U6J9_MANES
MESTSPLNLNLGPSTAVRFPCNNHHVLYLLPLIISPSLSSSSLLLLPFTNRTIQFKHNSIKDKEKKKEKQRGKLREEEHGFTQEKKNPTLISHFY